MIVEEYLERFFPLVRSKKRMTEIEGEAKVFEGEVKVVEWKVKVIEGKVKVDEGEV